MDANDAGMPGAPAATQHGSADDVAALGLTLEMHPGNYQWAYGDKVKYTLHSKVPLEPANVTWRVTNGHCVFNPCTNEDDCHQHEISLSADSTTGLSGKPCFRHRTAGQRLWRGLPRRCFTSSMSLGSARVVW
jgi:hypothetical protein